MIVPQKDIRATPLEILNFKKYESEEADMMKLILKNKRVFFDVGANLGWYSLLFSKVFSKTLVHSFEPISNTFNYLKSNVKISTVNQVKRTI